MLAYLKSFCFDRPVFVTYDLIENAIFAYVLQGFCAVLLKQRAQVLLADRCTNQDFAHANVSKISKTIRTYLNVSKISKTWLKYLKHGRTYLSVSKRI